MAVVDLSLNGLISRNLNLKNLSRYILVIEVHVCRNLEQLAYEVRREDIWESLGPSQTTQGGARSASRAWPKFATSKAKTNGVPVPSLQVAGSEWLLFLKRVRD